MDTPSPRYPPTGAAGTPPAGETPRDRAIRRLRSWKPSPEEKAILERARARGVGYSSIGVLSFAGAGFAFARYRKLNLLPTFMITSVAAFFGDQGGRLYSMYLGIKEMQTLPNSELRDIMKGFQKETMGAPVKPWDQEPIPVPARTPASPSSQPPSTSPNAAQPQTVASAWEKLRKETGQTSAWDALRTGRTPTASSPSDDHDDDHDDHPEPPIRAAAPRSHARISTDPSSTESTWDKLRHSPPESSDPSASSAWDALRSGSGHEHAPSAAAGPRVGMAVPPSMPQPPPAPYSGVATGMSSVRRNAYGDPVE